jgi:transporter family protein
VPAQGLGKIVPGALTAVLAKIGVTEVDPNVATAIRTSIIVFFTWAIAWINHTGSLIPASARTWTFLTLSAFATGMSWLCYVRALQLGPASKVAPIDKLSVVLVIVFASLSLNERLSAGKVIGGSLIAAGVVILAIE